MIDLSIVIVNWNNKQLIKDCLESIYRQTHDLKFEIVVVDNGSTDNSVDWLEKKYKQIKLLKNNQNLGRS